MTDPSLQAKSDGVVGMFRDFGIPMEAIEVIDGRNAVHIRLKPKAPIRMKTLKEFEDDLRFALGVARVEIEAPVLGTSVIAIKIPKENPAPLLWRDAVKVSEAVGTREDTLVHLGRDEFNNDVVVDLRTLPHLLIGGVTGSGKSSLLHSIINQLANVPAERLRLVLDDAKRVEFAVYNKLPHLLSPPITDPKKTLLALKWLNKELERRFDTLDATDVLDITAYHSKRMASALGSELEVDDKLGSSDLMPFIVLIIDEVADVMQAYPRDFEALLLPLLQMGRGVGIHVIIATSRPSTKVVSGMIKANIVSRAAFQVASSVDARMILDMAGAESLRGSGDMLFLSGSMSTPVRLQVPYISEEEIEANVDAVANTYDVNAIGKAEMSDSRNAVSADGDEHDDMYEEAVRVVAEAKMASTSLLQRKMRIGYSRAARLIDLLEERGIIGPADGAKPRAILNISNDAE